MTERATGGSDTSSTSTSADESETPATLAGSRVVSALRATSTRLELWVQHSVLYQWLTAEPDPEVIVIDLRETRTVGPVLRILDRIVDRLVVAADGSRGVAVAHRSSIAASAAPLRAGGLVIAAVGLLLAVGGVIGDTSMVRAGIGVAIAVVGVIAMQDDRDWETLRATRPVELVIAAFEPPEPPKSSGSSESTELLQTSRREQDDDQAVDTNDETQGIPLGENAPDERTDER